MRWLTSFVRVGKRGDKRVIPMARLVELWSCPRVWLVDVARLESVHVVGKKGESVIDAPKKKAPNRYQAGARFERKVRDALKEQFGFFVIRTPASKSPVDLIALRHGQILFVQCRTNGRLDPAEWNAYYALCIEVGAEALVASSEGGKIQFFQITGMKVPETRAQPWRRVTLRLAT